METMDPSGHGEPEPQGIGLGTGQTWEPDKQELAGFKCDRSLSLRVSVSSPVTWEKNPRLSRSWGR